MRKFFFYFCDAWHVSPSVIIVKSSEQVIRNAKNHVRELIEIGKEETWKSRNVESSKKKKPTRYLVTGIWKNKKKIPRMPSSNTQKLAPIITGIQKIQKQYFKFSPQVLKNLHHSALEFGKYEKEYLACIPCSNLRKLKPLGGTGIWKI